MKITSTGLSEMTLGTVQLGMRYGIANTIGKPSQETACQMIATAIGLGVNSLDTARAYGDSEQVIGHCLRQNPAWKTGLSITSKLQVQSEANAADADIQREMEEHCTTSLENLGVPQLRFLLLHRASDMHKGGGAVARAMEAMIRSGLIGGAGVSVYTLQEILEMLTYPVYTAVQLPLSVFDEQLIDSGILEELQRRGITVFVRSVYAQGLMMMDPDNLSNPLLKEFASRYLRELRARCALLNCSPVQYALSFVRHLPTVTSVVLGADSPAQVAENAALFEESPMDDAEFDMARHLFAKVPFDRIMEALR